MNGTGGAASMKTYLFLGVAEQRRVVTPGRSENKQLVFTVGIGRAVSYSYWVWVCVAKEES